MGKKLIVCALVIASAFLISCKNSRTVQSTVPSQGTFKVSILYPNGDGKTFDFDYYVNRHMPMVAGFLGKNLRFYEIDKGLTGRTATDKMPYLAIGYFYINDIAEYNKAVALNRDTIVADFKNYTNIQPVILISEIRTVGYAGAK